MEMVLGEGTCEYASKVQNWPPQYLDAKSMKLIPAQSSTIVPVWTTPKLQCTESAEKWDENCDTV